MTIRAGTATPAVVRAALMTGVDTPLGPMAFGSDGRPTEQPIAGYAWRCVKTGKPPVFVGK